MRARASSAQARVEQAKATLAQAELNLQYAVLKAPARGVVSRKNVNLGQVVQASQPLMAIVQTDQVWITANFKETQLNEMRPGQRGDRRASTRTAARNSRARSTASRRPRARGSACCRRRMRPATS